METQRNVHWALDISVSDFASATDTSSSSCTSTSTVQYINSQLIAHGFAASPGISLDGLSNGDMERVTKCFLAMLSQRVSDMSRADELSTKLRTLTYDHERLMGMHRASTDKVLNAEREVNMYKSRLATAARSLQSSESSHKQTSAELQRTRTSLQALRATHAAELKKKEKDIERMVEKWTKLADSQARSSTSPGMAIRGANAEVTTGMELLGKGKGVLEVALEHAESSRTELLNETTRLRRLVLVSANRLQSMIHEIRILASVKSEEPTSFDHDSLFPLTPINAADDKILSLFASANDAISIFSKHLSDGPNVTRSGASEQHMEADSEQCRHLQTVVEKLQAELDEAKKLHETHAIETRELLDQLAAQGVQRVFTDDLVASERDAEHDRLDRVRKELEDEREKFTRATVKLDREESAFESERIQFLEERRSLQVQQTLSEQPPVAALEAPPGDTLPLPSPGLAAYLPEVKKSPRKSPRKQKVVGKSGNSRKTRVSRRSSIFSIPPPANFEPAYETEVIPIVVPASKEPNQPANNKSSALTKSILPTSFVLPPPSPRTSLPPPDSLLEPLDGHIPEDDTNPESSSPPSSPLPPSFPNPIPTITEPEPEPAPTQKPTQAMPRTPPPLRRPFPMAKPLAPHMTHAYSPVKPSPLSRILMLANSPESPEPEPLPKSDTEDITPTSPVLSSGPAVAKDDSEDSPLREKTTTRNVVKVKKADKAEPKKRATKERGKGKEEPVVPAAASKPKAVGAGEKENRDKPSRRGSPPMLGGPPTKPPSTSASKPEAPAKATTKVPPKLPVGRGGARRVPIGSAEAAPLPGWRG